MMWVFLYKEKGCSIISYMQEPKFMCNVCKEELPSSFFYKDKSQSRGFAYSCKTCIKIRTLPNKRISWSKHKDKYNNRRKEYYKKYPEKQRTNNLKSHYGITIEQYDELYKKQGGTCAVCGWVPTNIGRYGKLCVDHSHTTNKVRGLLCHKCNLMLGKADDSIDKLQKAIAYLEKFQ